MEMSIVVTAVVFILALGAAAAWGGSRHALYVLRHLPMAVLPVMLGMSLFNYAMRCLRWLVFSKAIGLAVPRGPNALIYVAGFALTTTPGKLGEALRLWLLKAGYGSRYDRTATLLVGDRLADAVSTCVLIALTVAWLDSYAYVSIIAVAAVACMTLLCLRPGLLLLGVDTLYQATGFRPRLFARVKRVIRQLHHLATPRVFGLALLCGVAGWLSEGLSFYVLLHGLGAVIHPLTCVFIFCFAMVVGAISILPGGLGGTEATMIGLLTLRGVNLEIAILATAVVRVTTLWFAVGLGLIALPVALRRSRRRAALAAAIP